MNQFLSSISLKEIITATLAILGYILAIWQYVQKTKLEFRLKKYSEKRELYDKYLSKFAELNKAAKDEEQSLFEKEFQFKHSETKSDKEKMQITKSYVKDFLSTGLTIAKHLKENSNSLDILYVESSPEVLNYVNQLKDEYSKLSTEIHLELREVKKDASPKEVAEIMNKIADESKLKKVEKLQAEMLDQMRIELKNY